MDHAGPQHDERGTTGASVVCRTCHTPLRAAASHLRVVFGQVQVCHGPGGYVAIEVGPAGDGPSRSRRRRRRAA
jgi:hypothetical protein